MIDSGIGGLTIAHEIREHLRAIRLHYTADLAAFPYGVLDAEHIYQRLAQITQAVLKRHHPRLFVIACNTASTQVLERLRAEFAVPFVGVVPAIKPAAALTKTGEVLVLATPGTAQGHYIQHLIQEFAGAHTVFIHGSSVLVELAERELRSGVPAKTQELEQALPEVSSDTDTVVLACTHFPILRPQLTTILPQITSWVDSGAAIARRVAYVLNEPSATHVRKNKNHQHFFCCTGENAAPYIQSEIERRLGHFETDDISLF